MSGRRLGAVSRCSPWGLGLIPDRADARIPEEGITWNCTTWLNIGFLLPAAALPVRFLRTGRAAMMRMMGGSPEHEDEDEHGARLLRET